MSVLTELPSDVSSNISNSGSTRPNNGYENMPWFHAKVNEDLLREKPEKMTQEEYIHYIEDLANGHNFYEYSKYAAHRGYLEFLKQAHASGRNMSAYHLFFFAARKGHRKIMDWVEETYGKINNETGSHSCGAAAGEGRIEIVRYLVDRGFNICVSDYDDILTRGHVEVAKFMMEQENIHYHILINYNKQEYLIKDTALPLLKYYLDEYVVPTEQAKKEQKMKEKSGVEKEDNVGDEESKSQKRGHILQQWIDWAARCQQIEALKLLAEYGKYPSKQCFDKLFSKSAEEDYVNGKLGVWYREANIAEKAPIAKYPLKSYF